MKVQAQEKDNRPQVGRKRKRPVNAVSVGKRFFNRAEAAAYCGVSQTTIKRAKFAGELPAHHATRAPNSPDLFDIADLDAWILKIKSGREGE